MLACPAGELRVAMVRAEGLEPPHLAILEPKSSASTNSATRARPKRCGPIARMARRATRGDRRSLSGQGDSAVQQQPPIPETPPETPVHPSQPGQPTEPPPEQPTHSTDIDVPSPTTPGTTPPTGPGFPVGY